MVLVAVLGGLAAGQSNGGIAGVVVAVSLAVISKRAVRGDPRDRTLRRVAHRLIGRWGTQFVDADLTGADFSGTDPARAVFGLPLLLVTVTPAPIACRVRTAPSDSMRLGQPAVASAVVAGVLTLAIVSAAAVGHDDLDTPLEWELLTPLEWGLLAVPLAWVAAAWWVAFTARTVSANP